MPYSWFEGLIGVCGGGHCLRDEDFNHTLSIAAAVTNASVFKLISSCDGLCAIADIFLILHSAPCFPSASDVLSLY